MAAFKVLLLVPFRSFNGFLVDARTSSFPGMLGFDKRLQTVQVGLPENAILLQPRVHRLQRFRIELVQAMPSFTLLLHQVGTAQQAQVFGNRGTRHGKRPGNLSGRLHSLPQQVEYGPARRISQGMESSFRRICNRTVPHNA